MCGITGMVTWQEDVARYQADLKRMQAVLSNRGPDQQGIYQDTHCAMAHTRLAVIDVERGKPADDTADCNRNLYAGL